MKLLEQSTTAVNALAEAHAKLHILAEEQEVAAQRHSDLAQEYAMLEARYAEVQGPQQAAGLADRGWSITRQKNANCAAWSSPRSRDVTIADFVAKWYVPIVLLKLLL